MNLKNLLKEIKRLKNDMNSEQIDEIPCYSLQLQGIKETVEAIDSAECDFVWKEDNALIWDEIRRELGLK